MTRSSIAKALKDDLMEMHNMVYHKGEGSEVIYTHEDSEVGWAHGTVHDLHEVIRTKGAAFVIKNLTKTAKLELVKAWLEDNEKPKRQILRGEIIQDP